jgi:hypothetical protein
MKFKPTSSFSMRRGSLSKYGYSGSLRINFVHSGTTDLKGNLKPPNPRITNAAGSIQVGLIGNFGVDFATGGNSDGEFVHDHMLFSVPVRDRRGKWMPGRRIDPRTVFCKDLGF